MITDEEINVKVTVKNKTVKCEVQLNGMENLFSNFSIDDELSEWTDNRGEFGGEAYYTTPIDKLLMKHKKVALEYVGKGRTIKIK